MNLLLVVRSEIIASFILVFLIIYDRICAKYRSGKNLFLHFALTALGHVVMGLVTEITVNTPGFPVLVNDTFHVLFFAFALLFSLRYCQYTLSLIMERKKTTKYLVAASILCGLSIIVMIFSPIDYLVGKGTNYSAGLGPTLCYMLGFVLFIMSDIALILNRKRIDKHVLFTILPLSLISLSFMVVQIIVSEFLFTGCALTIATLGAFFAIENPVGKFRNTAFIDQNTGVWNRNCYEFDFNEENPKLLPENSSFIYVICDINGLKEINDTYGHLEGDKIIEQTALSITNCLASASKIYRIGGDEFVAVYVGSDESLVAEEINNVQEYTEKHFEGNTVPLSVSLGYAVRRDGESLEDTARRADKDMYQNKELYYKKKGIEHRA